MSKSLKQRVITAIVLVAICLPPLMLGGIPLRILMFAVAALSSYEIMSLRTKKPDWFMIIFLFVSIVVMYNSPVEAYPVVLSFFVIALFLIVFATKTTTIEDITYILIIVIILTLSLKGIAHIYVYGGKVMIFVALACFLCDTGAYLFGSKLGKHPMIPRISPKKTWEGSIGGLVTGFVVAIVFGMLFVDTLPFNLLLVSAITLPIIAQIGDLAFSSIKRHYGVKDYGSIFPGHGGVLDRIDSLLFCLMFFNALLIMWGL